MNEPKIVEKRPAMVDLAPGRYAWCSCGLSANQPYCDGSHKGTGFAPTVFTVEEARRAALCNCKHSQNKPFCDGSHAGL